MTARPGLWGRRNVLVQKRRARTLGGEAPGWGWRDHLHDHVCRRLVEWGLLACTRALSGQ
jgi:hypothetical protein